MRRSPWFTILRIKKKTDVPRMIEAGRATTPRRIRPIVLALSLPLALSGCGGDSPSQVRPPGTATETRNGKNKRDVSAAHPPAPPRQPAEPQIVYRPDDNRPQHDDEQLSQLGIHRYESKRLVLYTDIAPNLAQPLPGLMDQAYDAWVEYFGPPPPNRAGTEFQMTGYIMADRRLFRETGLLPEDLPGFEHGRNRGTVFWMNDQEHDYYRRHLMIHEGTHCFMTALPGVLAPSWYMEGMAELFGTHRTDAEGRPTFRIMPEKSLAVRGWRRQQIIAAERAGGRTHSLTDIFAYEHNSFLKTESYAWSWALAKFLDSHPRYSERFRELGRYLQGRQFTRKFQQSFREDAADLHREWALFAAMLDYGYDAQRAAIEFVPTRPLAAGEEIELEIRADRGWQSTGIDVAEDAAYLITAEGMVTLADEPRPWESSPTGITIRYDAGEPLGALLAIVVPQRAATIPANDVQLVGDAAVLRPRSAGTLFLRVNDAWGELSDNQGTYRVRIARRSGNS